MKLLYQDEFFVAIHKPSGFHVHPPEDGYPVPRENICLYLVRDLLGQHVYPVHRLDAGTSGVLIFALSSMAAREISQLFAERKTKKTYQAVVRGYVQTEGRIDLPLELDSTQTPVASVTSYRRLATVEFPIAVGNRFPTARYSWIEVEPETGRYHQIRRHFARISHPLLGDSTHGDSRHNQFFRNQVGIEGLCLKATRLEFTHPWEQRAMVLNASPCEKWNKIQQIFGAP